MFCRFRRSGRRTGGRTWGDGPDLPAASRIDRTGRGARRPAGVCRNFGKSFPDSLRRRSNSSPAPSAGACRSRRRNSPYCPPGRRSSSSLLPLAGACRKRRRNSPYCPPGRRGSSTLAQAQALSAAGPWQRGFYVCAPGTRRQIHAQKAVHRAAGILRCVLHGLGLGAHHMRRRHGGIAKGGVSLQLLDHRFVLFRGLHTGNAEGHDLNPSQLLPFFAQHLVERLGDLHGVGRQGAVTDAHIRNFRKGRLQGCEQLRFS